MMNWGLISLGFGLGTFKFMFAHWMAYAALGTATFLSLTELFISVTAGAWVSMSVFYWTSGWMMKRFKEKRHKKISLAIKNGTPLPKKKVFTKMNVFIVWIKRSVGIYGITMLAPLFLSIPLGSIVCAKFFSHKKRTFPLMLIFSSGYSLLMCLWIYFQ